jgi:hypothetical protein
MVTRANEGEKNANKRRGDERLIEEFNKLKNPRPKPLSKLKEKKQRPRADR